MFKESLKSPYDSRDYSIAAAMEVAGDVTIPDEYEVWTPPVEHQLIGNCVAQSSACLMEAVDHRDGLEHKDRSVGFIYFNDRSNTPGMCPRDAMLILKRAGDIYSSEWEHLDTDTPDVYEECWALSESITSKAKHIYAFFRIHNEHELKLYMMKYGLPAMGAGLCSEFISPLIDGRHAIAICGWRKNGDIHYQNSWGTSNPYTQNGKAWARFDEFEEVWGIVPNEIKKFSDVDPNRWSAEYIQKAVDMGILMGYEDNTFRPANTMTREEYATASVRQMQLIKKMIEEANPTLG